jgi:hypothetical protein
MEQKPSVGRVVHYVSYGTPEGESNRECRAAIVTEVSPESGFGPELVGLAVLNPTGMHFVRGSVHHGFDPAPTNPYVALNQSSGTWHWPERV